MLKIVFLFACMFGVINYAFSASFDCTSSNLNKTEVFVCEDSDLSELDDLLAVFYKDAKLNPNNDNLKNDQRQWIKERNKCPIEYHCISEAYVNRILRLAEKSNHTNSDMIHNPELFTAALSLEPSLADLPICEDFEDINNDGITEKICHPDCNGRPACGRIVLASHKNAFKYISELELGSSNSIYVAAEAEIPQDTLKQYDTKRSASDRTWKMIKIYYGYIPHCTSVNSYFLYFDDKYHEIFTIDAEHTFKGCE